MVSPYLTRPLRPLEEVLGRSRPNIGARSDGPPTGPSRRALPGAKKPVSRDAGKPAGPRLVWSNENLRGAAARRRGRGDQAGSSD